VEENPFRVTEVKKPDIEPWLNRGIVFGSGTLGAMLGYLYYLPHYTAFYLSELRMIGYMMMGAFLGWMAGVLLSEISSFGERFRTHNEPKMPPSEAIQPRQQVEPSDTNSQAIQARREPNSER
jgi:hypothetical protein